MVTPIPCLAQARAWRKSGTIIFFAIVSQAVTTMMKDPGGIQNYDGCVVGLRSSVVRGVSKYLGPEGDPVT